MKKAKVWPRVHRPCCRVWTTPSASAPRWPARWSPPSMSTANMSPRLKPPSVATCTRSCCRMPGSRRRFCAHVTSNKLGQAALALPDLTPAGGDDHLIDLPKGAIAWAIDKLDAPPALAGLVRRLLRGVAIVRDLETALRLKREHSVLQFATVAGEFISTAGVVFGGSTATVTESLLGRKTLISETAAEVAVLEKELTATREAAEQIAHPGRRRQPRNWNRPVPGIRRRTSANPIRPRSCSCCRTSCARRKSGCASSDGAQHARAANRDRRCTRGRTGTGSRQPDERTRGAAD